MALHSTRSTIRSVFQGPQSPIRLYIVVPLLLMAIALGVLAWRSYQLSIRMERGIGTLAIQYLHHAAEISASRADSVVRSEMFNASEEWQQIERQTEPSLPALERWLRLNPWIVSAIYLPDAEPDNAVYAAQVMENEPARTVRSELFTATGTIRYVYEPSRLLQVVRNAIQAEAQVHMQHMPESIEVREATQIGVVRRGSKIGFVTTELGPSVIIPLNAPMQDYAIEAFINNAYVGAGWQSHRTVSIALAVLAVVVFLFGGSVALRGLQREGEAMQLRSALIANISHELRTPLSMIRMGAETLKRGTRLSEKDRRDIEESILREVIHLNHMVENVLDVARISKASKALVFSPVDPAELVRSLVSTYESWIRSKGFEVDLEIAGAPGEQLWDREAVSRALLNLIDNAIKYSGEERSLKVRLADQDGYVSIAVIDKGIGIASGDLERIFEPYYRAQFSDTQTRRGAGLGLTLVQQIVSSHGGRMDVESTPGKGSTFRMLFPKQTQIATEPIRNLQAYEA